MCWKSEGNYRAKIGGVFYENVPQPIVCNDKPLITITRHEKTGMLGVNFELKTQDKTYIAIIENNEVKSLNTEIFNLKKRERRIAIIENDNGRIWCDLKFGIENKEFELDLSCLLFSESGYPIILHPNRSKFGRANENLPPNILHLTLTTEIGGTGSAIILDNSICYLLGVKIENFYRGVSVTHTLMKQ